MKRFQLLCEKYRHFPQQTLSFINAVYLKTPFLFMYFAPVSSLRLYYIFLTMCSILVIHILFNSDILTFPFETLEDTSILVGFVGSVLCLIIIKRSWQIAISSRVSMLYCFLFKSVTSGYLWINNLIFVDPLQL